MKRPVRLSLGIILLVSSDIAGVITPLDYPDAFYDYFRGNNEYQGDPGFAYLTPLGTGRIQSILTGTSYYTGVSFYSAGANLSTSTVESCEGDPGNAVTGCPATLPFGYVYNLGQTATTATRTVSSSGDSESYQGLAMGGAASLNASASFTVNRTSGSATQTGYVNDYVIDTTALTIAGNSLFPNGTAGSLEVGYLITPPTVTGSGTGADVTWYGQGRLQAWDPTGNSFTSSYMDTGVDFSTLTAPTMITITIPFTFGTPVILYANEDIGIGWAANTTGTVSASGSFDPMQSLDLIQVVDLGGNPLAGLTITDSLGNSFGPNGLVTPEPATYTLMIAGLLGLVGIGRRMRSDRS